jgi:hypothetical protein
MAAAAESGFEAMMEMHRPALTAMAQINGRLYESVAAINREWVSFVNQRLKEDLAVPQQVAACRSVQDMYRVYTEFLQNACSQYQAGFEQMAKLGKSMAEDTFKVLQSRLDESAGRKT